MYKRSDESRKLVSCTFTLIIAETTRAWLLADEVDEEEAKQYAMSDEVEYRYSMSGELYDGNKAQWFPKSCCKLKLFGDGSCELTLPTWLAEEKEIIDDCYEAEL